jgi:hypothetical protein
MTSRLVNSYENLLRENAAAIGSVESAIRNFTWFLPGRFADAEIASEGCESFGGRADLSVLFAVCHFLVS